MVVGCVGSGSECSKCHGSGHNIRGLGRVEKKWTHVQLWLLVYRHRSGNEKSSKGDETLEQSLTG